MRDRRPVKAIRRCRRGLGGRQRGRGHGGRRRLIGVADGVALAAVVGGVTVAEAVEGLAVAPGPVTSGSQPPPTTRISPNARTVPGAGPTRCALGDLSSMRRATRAGASAWGRRASAAASMASPRSTWRHADAGREVLVDA